MVSIIVPVYKVEKYLDRCVESLINQTIEDIEIILVDDGSPDNCPTMCDKWREKDCRIKVIHKKNGGLSSARNAGLDIAKGEYVGFVDSDDDVEHNMFELAFKVAKAQNADFVMVDYIRIFDNGEKKLCTANLDAGVYEKRDIIEKIYPSLIMGENVDYGPVLSVWHCLYEREFLVKNNLKFAEDVKWSEDNLFNAMAGLYANRFVYISGEGLYHYYQNPGTITTSYRFGAWDVYKKMNDYLQKSFLTIDEYDFSRQLKLHMIYYACHTVNMECKNSKNIRAAICNIKKILYDPKLVAAFENFKFPQVSWKLRIQLWLMKHKFSFILAHIIRS